MTGPARRAVVVGNGIAGHTAAHTLREAGFDGELTVVGAETHPTYSRPALSKALLRDAADPAAHQLPPPTHDATELLGLHATGLDLDRRLLTLDDNSVLPYDRLVLATGCRARRLSVSRREHTLRTVDDARALQRRLASRPSVVVVGGGALGMEIASACLAAGCAVTVVSTGPPLHRQLGPHLAEVFLVAARARGLTVIETGPARLDERADGLRVVLGSGEVLEAELVVTAAGDVPNTEWLAGTGLLCGDVLRPDTRGLVRPDIAAVGDLAALRTPHGVRRVALWTSAIEQAKVGAAALVLGDDAPELDLVPYFWTEQFGLTLKAVGHLPLRGAPTYLEGQPGGPALMQWPADRGPAAAAALNFRIAVPRLRRIGLAAA